MNDPAKFADPHMESLLPEVKFSRRGFLASAAATGFALGAGPVIAQTAIRTPAEGLDVADAKNPGRRRRDARLHRRAEESRQIPRSDRRP